MEGIETADAILAKKFPGSDLDQKRKQREERVRIAIQKLNMDRLDFLYEPMQPVSLMIDYSQKI